MEAALVRADRRSDTVNEIGGFHDFAKVHDYRKDKKESDYVVFESMLFIRLRGIFGRLKLPAKSVMPVRLSACIRAVHPVRFRVIFNSGTFMKISREIPDIIKIEKQHRALYMKIPVRVIVAGGIKAP